METIKNDDPLNITQNRYKKVHLSILKTADVYDYSDIQEIEYDYSFDEDYIMQLKEKYDIVHLQGETEFQTFLNTTNWVSSILSSKNILQKQLYGNSISIIEEVNAGKYAANCYAYAVVLNDVLCALGYKCKYVFCFPIDIHFTDCHVVNLVFSNKENKWMLFDSANNVCYTDNKGNILNLQELRLCFINDKDIEVHLLDSYKNVSNSNKTLIKQKIMTYMTKNLYRFGCNKNSQKDRGAVCSSIHFYNLVPVTYMRNPCCVSYYNHENKTKTTEHYLLNPKTFWDTPRNES